MNVKVAPEAVDDLMRGFEFYERREPGLGNVFTESLFSDLQTLRTLAGVHRVVHERHRCLSKRFPYAIYYVIQEGTAIVQAILDCRSDPGAIAERLQ